MSEDTAVRRAVGALVARAGTILVAGGVLLLALWFLGAAGLSGRLSYDASDNWFHFLLGIGLLGLASVEASVRRTRRAALPAGRSRAPRR